jgi:hypothetical protein
MTVSAGVSRAQIGELITSVASKTKRRVPLQTSFTIRPPFDLKKNPPDLFYQSDVWPAPRADRVPTAPIRRTARNRKMLRQNNVTAKWEIVAI